MTGAVPFARHVRQRTRFFRGLLTTHSYHVLAAKRLSCGFAMLMNDKFLESARTLDEWGVRPQDEVARRPTR